jgi:hypothetical protein
MTITAERVLLQALLVHIDYNEKARGERSTIPDMAFALENLFTTPPGAISLAERAMSAEEKAARLGALQLLTKWFPDCLNEPPEATEAAGSDSSI